MTEDGEKRETEVLKGVGLGRQEGGDWDRVRKNEPVPRFGLETLITQAHRL